MQSVGNFFQLKNEISLVSYNHLCRNFRDSIWSCVLFGFLLELRGSKTGVCARAFKFDFLFEKYDVW